MTGLQRQLGLVSLVLFGVGDILGSGIYGLVGKAAGQMGNFVWLAFLVSFVIALFTAFSYASLSSRFHKAAGSSFILWKAFGSPFLAFATGLATVASGLTSMATASKVFAGYFNGLMPGVSITLALIGFCCVLAGIVVIGVRQSIWVNSLCTIIELFGLLLIIAAGLPYVGQVNLLDTASIPGGGDLSVSLVLAGSVLTFYSFVGFEDMLNMGEEVVDPSRRLPLALMLSLTIASVIYLLVAVVAVSVLPPEKLGASSQPLVDVIKTAWPDFPAQIFSFIAMFAVANTALLNFIMASRLFYGLARMGLLPHIIAHIHPKTRTPWVSVGIVLVILLVLGLSGDVSSLARATSIFLLLVFIGMNLSLVQIQRRDPHYKSWRIPNSIPIFASFGAVAMLFHAKSEDLVIAGTIIGLITLMYFVRRPNKEQIEKLDAIESGH